MVVQHNVIDNKQYGFYEFIDHKAYDNIATSEVPKRTLVLLYIRHWNGVRINGKTNFTEIRS